MTKTQKLLEIIRQNPEMHGILGDVIDFTSVREKLGLSEAATLNHLAKLRKSNQVIPISFGGGVKMRRYRVVKEV